jgi:hypothetical protein
VGWFNKLGDGRAGIALVSGAGVDEVRPTVHAFGGINLDETPQLERLVSVCLQLV